MNGERPLPADDAERDAWLRAALRHAPDAQVGPPPALSDLILREAQAKAKTPQPAPAAPRWWAWLARPSVGAAFASVMVATAVGLVWWDRPLEDHAPRPTAITPEPALARASELAAPPVQVAAAPQPPVTAPVAPPPRAKREALRAPIPTQPERRDAAGAAADQAAQRFEAPPPAAGANAKAAGTAETMAATPSSMPPPAAPPAPAAAPATTLAESTRPAGALAAQSRDLRQRLAVSADTASLADLRASLALDASRWTWRRGEAGEQPVGDRITAWLAQLDAETGARWQHAPGAPADAAAAAQTLVLRHEGGALHRLRLGDGIARWETTLADGSVRRWQATLDGASEQALRTRLHEATQ